MKRYYDDIIAWCRYGCVSMTMKEAFNGMLICYDGTRGYADCSTCPYNHVKYRRLQSERDMRGKQ